VAEVLSRSHASGRRMNKHPSKGLPFVELVNELRWQLQLNVDTHPSIMAVVDAACETLMIDATDPLYLRVSACYDCIYGCQRSKGHGDTRTRPVAAIPDGVLVNGSLYLQNRLDEAFKFLEAGQPSPRVLCNDGASDAPNLSKLITRSRPPSARSRPSSARLPAAAATVRL